MSVPSSADVVVIGGGPAGCTAATLLAHKGYDVVLLEKARHPRYIVGESLLPHVWRYCDLIGATPRIQAEGFLEKAGGTVAWGGQIRQMSFAEFGFDRPALHVERDRFDHLLVEHTRSEGVAVHEEVAATDVSGLGGPSPQVSYREAGSRDKAGEIGCKVVIDATGQGTLIGRQRGVRQLDPVFRYISLWGYFEGSSFIAADGRIHPQDALQGTPPTTLVESLDDLGGWSWHIALRNEASVGIVVPPAAMAAGKADTGPEALEQFFVDTCRRAPQLGRLLEGARLRPDGVHAIRDFSYLVTEPCGPGWYCVGDAAAFVDPIFSLGVTLAMYSAYLAAWATDRGLRHPDRAESSQGVFRSQLGHRYRLARALCLPQYGIDPEAYDAAGQAVGFESARELELMYVASLLTDRGRNLEAILTGSGLEQPVCSDRFREIDELVG